MEDGMRLDSKAGLLLGGVSAIAAADLATKWAVRESLSMHAQVRLISDFVRLTYIHNPGAAFGIHLGEYSRVVLLALTVIALVAVVAVFIATPKADRQRLFALTAIAGGAVGNLLNRILTPRGVVDWIDVGIGHLRWPVFNLADITITTGAILLALSLWSEDAGRHGARQPS